MTCGFDRESQSSEPSAKARLAVAHHIVEASVAEGATPRLPRGGCDYFSGATLPTKPSYGLKASLARLA